MKKVLFSLIALILSVSSYAQLISEKSDAKLTLGFDIFTDFQLKVPDNYQARGINQGVGMALTYNFPLGNSAKNTVAIGVGMTSHNYFSKSVMDNPYADTLAFTLHDKDDKFKRYKINPTYLDVPLELRFRINDSWKIGVGFKFGVMVWAKTKYVYKDGNGNVIREKYCGINDLEKYAYSATLRVGYKWVSAYAAFQFSRAYEVGSNGPEIFPLSVGLTFAPF
jgi:hypothetical protein